MLSPIEELIQRASAIIAYLGGILSAVFASFQEAVMAHGGFVISVLALFISWYYQRLHRQLRLEELELKRREDVRKQTLFEQEMAQGASNEQHRATPAQDEPTDH
jgi:hypothetical protein